MCFGGARTPSCSVPTRVCAGKTRLDGVAQLPPPLSFISTRQSLLQHDQLFIASQRPSFSGQLTVLTVLTASQKRTAGVGWDVSSRWTHCGNLSCHLQPHTEGRKPLTCLSIFTGHPLSLRGCYALCAFSWGAQFVYKICTLQCSCPVWKWRFGTRLMSSTFMMPWPPRASPHGARKQRPCQTNSRCYFRQILELWCCSHKGGGGGGSCFSGWHASPENCQKFDFPKPFYRPWDWFG